MAEPLRTAPLERDVEQVEELTHKSQLLEADLERTSRQLREVTAIAGKETSRCNAAKEVIKSLTERLKDMAERVPEGYTINNNSCSNASPTFNQSNLTSNENNRSSYLAIQTPDGTEYASDPLPCNPTKTLAEETEWVEQTEPGVYITFSSYRGGEIHLKRVRFSYIFEVARSAISIEIDDWLWMAQMKQCAVCSTDLLVTSCSVGGVREKSSSTSHCDFSAIINHGDSRSDTGGASTALYTHHLAPCQKRFSEQQAEKWWSENR